MTTSAKRYAQGYYGVRDQAIANLGFTAGYKKALKDLAMLLKKEQSSIWEAAYVKKLIDNLTSR